MTERVPYYPSPLHDIVLALVGGFDQPVSREELHWAVDHGVDADSYRDLGPRPRRDALFTILGDLADKNLIEMSTEGFTVPDKAAVVTTQPESHEPAVPAPNSPPTASRFATSSESYAFGFPDIPVPQWELDDAARLAAERGEQPPSV